MAALPGPVVNAHDTRVGGRLRGVASDNAEQRVIAHRQEQTAREALSRPTTQRETKVVNNALKA